MVHYKDYITIESGKRSGKPCIRGLRITVYDILERIIRKNMVEIDAFLKDPHIDVLTLD